MTADILKCPVVTPVESESGALGAGRMKSEPERTGLKYFTDKDIKLNDTGRCLPEPENQSAYDRIYDHYLAIHDAMEDLNKKQDWS